MFFFFKQKTAYDMRISDWSSDVCSSYLLSFADPAAVARAIGPGVDLEAVTALLSRPMTANEQFRCRPGLALSAGCGVLPAGTSGQIGRATFWGRVCDYV